MYQCFTRPPGLRWYPISFIENLRLTRLPFWLADCLLESPTRELLIVSKSLARFGVSRSRRPRARLRVHQGALLDEVTVRKFLSKTLLVTKSEGLLPFFQHQMSHLAGAPSRSPSSDCTRRRSQGNWLSCLTKEWYYRLQR